MRGVPNAWCFSARAGESLTSYLIHLHYSFRFLIVDIVNFFVMFDHSSKKIVIIIIYFIMI
jgi:hypothetical protein